LVEEMMEIAPEFKPANPLYSQIIQKIAIENRKKLQEPVALIEQL